MTKRDYDINLDALCEKLETVCRKVWDDDRVSAVPLQAVSNELIAGIRRAEEIIASLRQDLQSQRPAITREFEEKLALLQEKIEHADARTASVNDELRKVRAKIDALRKDLEAKEDELSLFQEKYLKLEVQKDSARTDHMEKFIEEQDIKERERENFWKQRHLALEKDLKTHEADFENRRRSLMEELQSSAEEARKLNLRKEAELAETQKQLQAEFHTRGKALQERELEYARKYEELEKLKQNLRAEIAELTRQYPRAAKDATENK